jgi:phage-related tail fiber protein
VLYELVFDGNCFQLGGASGGSESKRESLLSVLVATTANIVLSGTQTVDGVVLSADSRVLVKDQAQAKDNGIYTVTAGGAWKRAQDADTSIEVTPGLFVTVEKGAVHGDSVWQLVTDAPIVLGTTALTFEIIAGPTGIGAGTYRSVTVDKLGRVIAGTNPTTLAGAGITDAVSSNNDVAIVGKIADVDKCRFINGSGAAGTTDMPPVGYVAGIRAKYPGGKLAFDLVGSMTAGEVYGRTTFADGSGSWYKFWTSANFAPSDYIPKNGGAYYPKLSGLSINSEVGGYDSIGGYIGWGSSGSGTMQFICNKGGGNTGGFLWGTVNADNNTIGPMMKYLPDGTLSVPAAVYVPAITSNTTVPTQGVGYAGQFVANGAFVAAAVQYKINGNACNEAGFIGGDSAAPYMKNINGTVVRLQVDSPKDTATFGVTSSSKNGDTGEILQYFEVAIGDIPAGGKTMDISWPFAFPKRYSNVVSFVFRSADATIRHISNAYFSMPTISGCRLQVDEDAQVVQPASLTLLITVRGE